MSEIEEWRQNPLEVVQRIVSGLEARQVCSEGDLGIPKALIAALQLDCVVDNGPEGLHHSIPLLNEVTVEDQEELSGGRLVRFRCMVQDTLEPEYYIAGYIESDDVTGASVLKTLRYSESPQEKSGKTISSLDDDLDLPIERGVLNCVSIPGEQPWFGSILNGGRPISANGSRPLECIVKTYPQSLSESSSSVWGAFPKGHDHLRVGDVVEFVGILWRECDEDACTKETHGTLSENELQQGEQEEEEELKITDAETNENECKEGSNKDESSCSHKSCSECKDVKSTNQTSFRLHAITHRMIHSSELPGKYCRNFSGRQDVSDANGVEAQRNLRALTLPKSLLAKDSNELNNSKIETEAFIETAEKVHNHSENDDEYVTISFEGVQKSVIKLLRWAAFGDEIAAKFLLLNILSRVYERKAGRCMGRFNLALTHISKGLSDSQIIEKDRAKAISERFQKTLALLQPTLVSIVVSLNSLNEKRWAPVRLPENDFMQPARLQLPQGTSLILNELDMGQGTLENNGVLNVRALGKLLKSSVLTYDFIYSEHDLPIDIPTLSLAESNAFLPSDVILPLQPNPQLSDINDSLPTLTIETLCGVEITGPIALGVIRKYLMLSREGIFELTADQSQMVQETIVSLLQNGNRREVLTEEHFHIRLTIARLLSQSLGESSLQEPAWTETQDLSENLLLRQEQFKASKTSGSGL